MLPVFLRVFKNLLTVFAIAGISFIQANSANFMDPMKNQAGIADDFTSIGIDQSAQVEIGQDVKDSVNQAKDVVLRLLASQPFTPKEEFAKRLSDAIEALRQIQDKHAQALGLEQSSDLNDMVDFGLMGLEGTSDGPTAPMPSTSFENSTPSTSGPLTSSMPSITDSNPGDTTIKTSSPTPDGNTNSSLAITSVASNPTETTITPTPSPDNSSINQSMSPATPTSSSSLPDTTISTTPPTATGTMSTTLPTPTVSASSTDLMNTTSSAPTTSIPTMPS